MKSNNHNLSSFERSPDTISESADTSYEFLISKTLPALNQTVSPYLPSKPDQKFFNYRSVCDKGESIRIDCSAEKKELTSQVLSLQDDRIVQEAFANIVRRTHTSEAKSSSMLKIQKYQEKIGHNQEEIVAIQDEIKDLQSIVDDNCNLGIYDKKITQIGKKIASLKKEISALQEQVQQCYFDNDRLDSQQSNLVNTNPEDIDMRDKHITDQMKKNLVQIQSLQKDIFFKSSNIISCKQEIKEQKLRKAQQATTLEKKRSNAIAKIPQLESEISELQQENANFAYRIKYFEKKIGVIDQYENQVLPQRMADIDEEIDILNTKLARTGVLSKIQNTLEDIRCNMLEPYVEQLEKNNPSLRYHINFDHNDSVCDNPAFVQNHKRIVNLVKKDKHKTPDDYIKIPIPNHHFESFKSINHETIAIIEKLIVVHAHNEKRGVKNDKINNALKKLNSFYISNCLYMTDRKNNSKQKFKGYNSEQPYGELAEIYYIANLQNHFYQNNINDVQIINNSFRVDHHLKSDFMMYFTGEKADIFPLQSKALSPESDKHSQTHILEKRAKAWCKSVPVVKSGDYDKVRDDFFYSSHSSCRADLKTMLQAQLVEVQQFEQDPNGPGINGTHDDVKPSNIKKIKQSIARLIKKLDAIK